MPPVPTLYGGSGEGKEFSHLRLHLRVLCDSENLHGRVNEQPSMRYALGFTARPARTGH
jgi:hypothetical protein